MFTLYTRPTWLTQKKKKKSALSGPRGWLVSPLWMAHVADSLESTLNDRQVEFWEDTNRINPNNIKLNSVTSSPTPTLPLKIIINDKYIQNI